MQTKLIVGIFLMSAFVACEKKSDETNPNAEDLNYFPLSIGSYWIYDCFEMDSTGKETIVSRNDTIKITGDTLINGNEYSVFYGKEYAINSWIREFYYRDSLGYIVNEKGEIKFSSNNLIDTLYKLYPSPDSIYFIYAKMETYPNEILLSAGRFNSILNYKTSVEQYNPDKRLIGKTDKLFAPKVGRILRQYFYVRLYDIEKRYYEERLVDYYIAP